MGKICYFYSLLLTILLYFLSVNTVFANQKDSLLLLIEETIEPERKVDLFNRLAYIHTDTAFVEAQKYADLAYQLAVDSEYPLGEAESLYYKGRSLAMSNQFQASLEFVEKAVLITEKLPEAKKKQAQYTVLQGWINDKISR